MQQEIKIELSLLDGAVEQQILSIFQEIKEGYLVESNDILEDLNPLMSKLRESDKKKVVQVLNKHFRNYEFVRNGGYWLQGKFDLQRELIDFTIVYHSCREKNDYESILDKMKMTEFRRQNSIPDEFFANLSQLIKLKIKSLLVFDLLDYFLNKKDLTQIEILKILLELFYCNSIFTDDESKAFEQLIGFLLQKQLYEITYYIEILKKDDPQNYMNFVQLLQKLQLKIINETNNDLQIFLKINQRYRNLLVCFSKEIINSRLQLQQFISQLIQIRVEKCQFTQIISYINNIENVNDQLNDVYLLIVFYYWKKYCIQYNLQIDLKNQEDSLPNLIDNERKLKFIERYFNKQKSNSQDKIYLFVIHKICYFVEEIENVLCKDTYEQFIQTMANDVKNYKQKKQQLISNMKDKSKFFEYWKIIHSLKFYKQEISQQNNQIARLITNLLWINNQNDNLFNILNKITSNQNKSFLQVVQFIENEINQINIANNQMDLNIFKINVLRIIYAQFPQEEKNYLMLRSLIQIKYQINLIHKIVQLQHYFCYNQQKELVSLSQDLFQQDQQLYEEWFNIAKPSQVILQIEYLKVKKSQSYYPKQMDIPLEDFNISLSEYCEQEQRQILSNWIQDMTDIKKFKEIIPLFFNIIKRGESPSEMLINANQILQNYKKIADGIGCFNLKSLFQIFFNNANDELKVILMKFFSKEYPIPFLYQNPILDNLNSKTEIFLLNSNLFYLIEKGYTIINLSLSQNQKKIGKTELINQIFYKREKFETSDTCQMNSNTIDIMLDFEFNNSRDYILADVHGTIIFEILIKILSFFQLWIVQLDSQKELQENLDQIRIILQQIGQQHKDQLEICFIVRNTDQTELINEKTITYEIERKNIQIFYIHNLIANNIDKQQKISQIENVSKFLFNRILNHQERLQLSNLQSQNKKNQFLQVLKQFNPQYQINIQQINNHQNLIYHIQSKLNQILNEQDGFYSQNAFPIRRIQWNIKNLRKQNYELCMKPTENKKEIEKNIQQMQEQEKQIQQQKSTELLKIFCQIFSQKHYYIVYLWIVDQIRQFNEKNLLDLQQKDYQLNEQFNNLKQEKRMLKQQHLNNLQELCEDQKNKKIKYDKDKLKQQMDINAQNIFQKNVSIELFWRELISLRQSNYCELKFDPVETISQLIRKGESLEFLDGDTLSINTQFLFDLEKNLTQNKQQKILVISILGPQSSGKSTILNKIFGCHFWTSVGRCTKGIHLQILQVQNKQVFQNFFDQILILDTEGLQNPNQIDSEFDKKIALFVLSISDIIMINIKGEINQQFKSLVEMCIFTLGHLKNGLSMFKQLSWFFNQNDNYKNVQPFRQQIKDLAQNLNLQWNENYFDQKEDYIDYADILDIKDNISGLGFASDQKDWGKNGWNQSVNNHTFSREAYQQGINMIKQFISKLYDQKDSLDNFNHFLQNVQRNWESIEKLPDLLEFSELIQHQQNLIMKKYFDDLWKSKHISQIGERLIQDTIKQIQKKESIVFDVYKEIQQSQEKKIESTYTQIQKQIIEQMNSFKSEYKIQKKIMQKYLQKLEIQMKAEEIACQQQLSELIQQYEGEYQQKKGYVQIENFIQSVLSNESMKKKFKGNDKLIEQAFKIKWNQFLSETNRASEQQYLEMVDTQYKAMKSISNHYILNTINESEYFNYFRDNIIKQNPYDILNKEQGQIFKQYMQEFQKTEQFICINNNNKQNYAYLDIFHQKIQEKIEKSKDQLLGMKQFYSQTIKYQVVAKSDISNYIQHQFENDFQQFLQKYENHNNIKSCYFKFISFLDYMKISYNNKLKEVLNKIFDLDNDSIRYQLVQMVINQNSVAYQNFQNFKKSFQYNYNNNQEIDLTGFQIGQTFKDTYQSLKITEKTIQSWNTIKYKKDIQQNYIIIGTQIEIQPNQNSYQESFNYIKSPQDQTPTYFRTNFPKQFNKIMIELNGWNKLYNQLYILIKKEIHYSKYKIEHQGSNQLVYINNYKEDENIQGFNPYLITSIMQKVENNIKVKYNNEFAQFGVILTDVGERCINYYSMLIIWRFFCYQRWYSKKIQQQHKNNYQNELNRCIAKINEDNLKQSCIKATELINKIQIQLKNQFLNRTKKEVLQKMNSVSMSNYNLIAKLDKELLIDVDEKKFEDQQFQKQILSYTTDHKQYINEYTQDLLTQLQIKLLKEFSNKYRQELSLYLKSILKNSIILYKYIQNQKEEIKTIMYFNEDNNQQDKIFYENQLFRLLMQCLLGKIEDKINIINQQYIEIFQVSNYEPIKSQFTIDYQLFNQQDQQVYNLKNFVDTLIRQIDQILNNINEIQFNSSEYQLDVVFGKLKLQLNGCEYTCPCCKRKCDQENENNHTHKCQNGHQIRGINGILISDISPSLYTCEEISDECMIKTLETNIQKTWKEVKKTHSNWDFQCVNFIEMLKYLLYPRNLKYEQNFKNKEKWKNVWNIGLGKLICSHLKKQLNHEVKFSQKSEQDIYISNIHYILILDDSGSMKGDKWDKAKNGALNCIKLLEKTDCAKVSVIIFNTNARIGVECQKPNYQEMNNKITYNGGNTSFEPPFKLALELIKKYKDFNKISILFYTDGEADYPENIVEQFCQLPQEIRKLINLTACSGEKSSQTLALIIKKFQQYMQSAQLRNSVQPVDIQSVWTEVVSKNIHQGLA